MKRSTIKSTIQAAVQAEAGKGERAQCSHVCHRSSHTKRAARKFTDEDMSELLLWLAQVAVYPAIAARPIDAAMARQMAPSAPRR